MPEKRKSNKERFYNVILKPFRKGIKTRDAIGVSIILHILAGTALAYFLSGTVYVVPPKESHSIEFDLITETVRSDLAGQVDGKNPQDLPAPGIESKSNGGGSSSATNAANREAIVSASLASLSQLRESFNFVTQNVASDSASSLTPVHGRGPNSDVFGSGLGSEAGYDNGSGIQVIFGGGGVCTPNHGGIY
ncbi:hypothetical protein GWO43_06985 [candidate division KSB1 bacterium]|nr:hypothetical protein [candidate division KSB1 bacterium]NIR72752.1 hypothetical protein [candidate division KSB1 bacterium]NIS23708.1 hypothetical protein [candidate division KSB1 bacterium]NIT70628.1 hypothetical protein [candidate division KSB1 bacterium]NIU24356.1 hypothetical protein [candidate division KSB1 bacterium]